MNQVVSQPATVNPVTVVGSDAGTPGPEPGLRVGVDLVRVSDIEGSVSEFGERYLNRIFCPQELTDCSTEDGCPDPQRLAARYAAKEASVKVLRPVGHCFNWRDIEVMRSPIGSVSLVLHGPARDHALAQGLRCFSVSLSHEHAYAVAVVIGSP